jgi:hypothetical protein
MKRFFSTIVETFMLYPITRVVRRFYIESRFHVVLPRLTRFNSECVSALLADDVMVERATIHLCSLLKYNLIPIDIVD